MNIPLPRVNVDATAILAIGAVGVVGALLLAAYLKRREVAAGLDPSNRDNFVNRGVSGIGAAITGNPDWSLGLWLADVFQSDPLANDPDFQKSGDPGGAGW